MDIDVRYKSRNIDQLQEYARQQEYDSFEFVMTDGNVYCGTFIDIPNGIVLIPKYCETPININEIKEKFGVNHFDIYPVIEYRKGDVK